MELAESHYGFIMDSVWNSRSTVITTLSTYPPGVELTSRIYSQLYSFPPKVGRRRSAIQFENLNDYVTYINENLTTKSNFMTGRTASTARCRRWGITSWGEDPLCYDVAVMDYMVRVHHLAPTTGRPHWHTFVIFKKELRLAAVKKAVADRECHCIPLRKDDTTYLEDGHDADGPVQTFGELPIAQGHRTDVEDFKAAIDSGMSLAELSDKFFSQYMRFSKMILQYRALHTVYRSSFPLSSFKATPIDDWTKHWHLWGPPDTGVLPVFCCA